MSQPIAVSCPHCQAQFAVQDPRLIGQQVACPGCGQPFVVAAPTQNQPLGGAQVAAAAGMPQQQPFPQQPQQQPLPQQAADPLAMPSDPLAMPSSDPLADPLGGPLGGGQPIQRPMAGGYGHRGKKKGGNWQKPAMIGGGVVLGLAMLMLLISLLQGGGARRGSDGNVVDMTWLPPDSEVVSFIDVNSLVRSKLVQDQIASDPNATQAIQQMEQQTGLRPQDIESVTFGGKPQSNSGIGVIRLSKDFDTAKLGGATMEEVNGCKVYTRGNIKVMVCDPRTIVVGEAASITASAQRGAQKQRFKQFDFVNAKQDVFFCWVPSDLSELRKATSNAPPVAMMPGAPQGAAEAMTALQNNVIAVAGGGSLSGGDLDVSIQVNTDDSGASGDLASGLNSLISEGRSQYDTVKGMIPAQYRGIADKVVSSLAARRSGKAVTLNVSLPTEEMQAAIKSQMPGMPGRGGPFSGFKNPLEGLGNFGGLGGGMFGSGGSNTPPPAMPNTSVSPPNMGSAVTNARTAAQRMENANKLKQIGLAFHNHMDTYRSFPPAANQNAKLSWRVHLLPFLEERALYDRFNLQEPWDSPTNKALIAQMPSVYMAAGIAAPPGKTVFLGAATPGGIFEDPTKGGHFRDVLDGTSNTAMAVMAMPNLAVEWTKPGDYAPAGGPPQFLYPYQAGNQGVIHPILFCDGAVINLNANMPKADWQNIFNRKDGNIVDFR